MNRNEKITHEVCRLGKQEQEMISGGYAPVTPPIAPLGNSNGIPDFKLPSEEDFRCY